VRVDTPADPRQRKLRLGLIVLLLLAAFFAVGPWLGCVVAMPMLRFTEFTLRACTFGDPALRGGWGLPGFTGPYWGNLIAGIVYAIAVLAVAFTRRRL